MYMSNMWAGLILTLRRIQINGHGIGFGLFPLMKGVQYRLKVVGMMTEDGTIGMYDCHIGARIRLTFGRRGVLKLLPTMKWRVSLYYIASTTNQQSCEKRSYLLLW